MCVVYSVRKPGICMDALGFLGMNGITGMFPKVDASLSKWLRTATFAFMYVQLLYLSHNQYPISMSTASGNKVHSLAHTYNDEW